MKRKHNLEGVVGGRYQQRMKIQNHKRRCGQKGKVCVADYLTDYILLPTLSPHTNFEQLAYRTPRNHTISKESTDLCLSKGETHNFELAI